MPTPAQLAAFRMRCWNEMGECKPPHYADAYHQLVEDANATCDQIHQLLKRKQGMPSGPAHEESLNTRAELLITALVGGLFCRSYGKRRFDDFIDQAHALVPRLANSQLLCYMLVLLFCYDEHPAKGMMSLIEGMVKLARAKEVTPEDMHITRLYRSKVENMKWNSCREKLKPQ